LDRGILPGHIAGGSGIDLSDACDINDDADLVRLSLVNRDSSLHPPAYNFNIAVHDLVMVFIKDGFAARDFDESIQDGVGLGQFVGCCKKGPGGDKKGERKLVH
jgi:hypothetical protein